MPFVSIDGSIGCGKTTVIKKLKSLGISVAEEPVHEWTEWLEKYYKNNERWGFSFQMKVIIGQTKILNDIQQEQTLIMERSPQTVYYVFASMLKDKNIIHKLEYDLIEEFINYNTKPVNTIYLRCPPEICMKRIHQRGRDSEKSIHIDYLQKLHEKYENMPHSFVVDSSQSEEDVYNDIMKILISCKYIK